MQKNSRNWSYILKIILPILILGPMLIFGLTSCSTPIDSTSIVNSLLPNLWVFISHVFASVILIIIIVWLVWKPTNVYLQKRHDYIVKEINEAEQANKKALEHLQAASQQKIDAYNQAANIIENAQKESFIIKEKTQIEAKSIADKIRLDAQIEAEQNQENIINEMDNKIVDLAFTAAEAILKKEVKSKDNADYINELMDDLKKEYK